MLNKQTSDMGEFREKTMQALDTSSDIGVKYLGSKEVIYGRVSQTGLEHFVLVDKDDKAIKISFDEVLDIY